MILSWLAMRLHLQSGVLQRVGVAQLMMKARDRVSGQGQHLDPDPDPNAEP
jgi:hypothetical protein